MKRHAMLAAETGLLFLVGVSIKKGVDQRCNGRALLLQALLASHGGRLVAVESGA